MRGRRSIDISNNQSTKIHIISSCLFVPLYLIVRHVSRRDLMCRRCYCRSWNNLQMFLSLMDIFWRCLGVYQRWLDWSLYQFISSVYYGPRCIQVCVCPKNHTPNSSYLTHYELPLRSSLGQDEVRRKNGALYRS